MLSTKRSCPKPVLHGAALMRAGCRTWAMLAIIISFPYLLQNDLLSYRTTFAAPYIPASLPRVARANAASLQAGNAY